VAHFKENTMLNEKFNIRMLITLEPNGIALGVIRQGERDIITTTNLTAVIKRIEGVIGAKIHEFGKKVLHATPDDLNVENGGVKQHT
jgi:hypothetical protein